jgi:hypothetical protein
VGNGEGIDEVGEEVGRDGHGDGVRFAAAEHEGDDWGEPRVQAAFPQHWRRVSSAWLVVQESFAA